MTSQISLESLNLSWVHRILLCSFCLAWNLLPELISRGVGIRMSWVENFLKINKRGETSIGDQRVDECKIAGIGVLKNINVALCRMKNTNLTKESIKILGVHISYNKKIQGELNFIKTIKNIWNVIKLWRMRKLTLEGKITIFKSLVI